MHTFFRKLGILPVALIALFLTGCLLTGTFVIYVWYRDVDLQSGPGYYYTAMDVTEEEDWKDHEDKIKDVDQIGFELWLTNNNLLANTVEVYVAPLSSNYNGTSAKNEVRDNTTKVMKMALPANGELFVGYAESFDYMEAVDQFRDIAGTGQFKFWAMSQQTPVDFTIDSVKIVVTFTAGK